MKAVVTGGTGFIGSHLVRGLLGEEREVIVASNSSSLAPGSLLGLGLKASDMELRKVDLRDYAQALDAVEGADVVFHLAARVGSIEYLHGTVMSELSTLQTNLVIDANIFKACLEKGVDGLVYASSVAVYPMDKQRSPEAVFHEDDLMLRFQDVESEAGATGPGPGNHVDPDGGYGWAKLLGEIQLSWVKGIGIGIARIFNIYGENEPLGERGHAVADLIQKAILYPEAEFTVWGNGEQTRDFLHVSDCVEALLRLRAAVSDSAGSTSPMTVNVGSGDATSIREIAERIAGLSGKNARPVYELEKPVGPLSRTADISRAKMLLNWQPRIGLDQGLKRTHTWVQTMMEAGSVSRRL